MIARERNGLIRKDDRLSSPTRSIYKSGSIAWGSFEGLATLFVIYLSFLFRHVALTGEGEEQRTIAPKRDFLVVASNNTGPPKEAS